MAFGALKIMRGFSLTIDSKLAILKTLTKMHLTTP